jgi:hypothetical protein
MTDGATVKEGDEAEERVDENFSTRRNGCNKGGHRGMKWWWHDEDEWWIRWGSGGVGW